MSDRPRWLAFDIGCIECGEGSDVIGLYETEEAATAACDDARKTQGEDWNGQHHMEVFDLDAVNTSDPSSEQAPND